MMFSNFAIGKIRTLINKERTYALMLAFILLVNAWIIFAEKPPGFEDNVAQRSQGGPEDSTTVYDNVNWEELLETKQPILIFINILGLAAILLFSLGFFLDIRILMAKIKKRTLIATVGRPLLVKWEIRDIFKLAIIFVFFGYLLHIIEAGLLPSGSGEKGRSSVVPLLNTGILDLALLGSIIYFVKVKYKQSLAALGLKIKDCAKSILLGMLSYIAFIPILSLLLLLLIMLAAVFNYQPPAQRLFDLFLQEKSAGFLVYSTLIVIILGPIAEEVFFRGFTYNALKRRLKGPAAAVLTAVVFAGLHANLFGFLPIMALGLLLAYVYEKTGSLVPSITIHILHNFFMVALLFLTRYFMSLAGNA